MGVRNIGARSLRTVNDRVLVERLEPRSLLAGDFGFAVGIGGAGQDSATDVGVDAAGNAYVTGAFTGTVDFDRGPGVQSRTSRGGDDGFVAKYSPGGALLWVRTFGAGGADEGMALAVDGGGNVVVTGFFAGTVDFDPNAGTFNLTSGGGQDAFALKLTPAGNLAWARSFRGGGSSGGTALTVDGAGRVYAVGMFDGTVDLDPGPGVVTAGSAGGLDVYLAKLSASGAFVYGKKLGGSGTDYGNGVAVDGGGNVTLVGSFFNTIDLDPGAGVSRRTSAGNSDVFVTRLSGTGAFVRGGSVGGASADQAGDVQADAVGNVVVTGNFKGTADLDPGPGTTRLTSAGDSDAFVLKLSPSHALAWARRIGGAKRDRGTDLALDSAGNVFFTGHFAGTVDFDPLAGTSNLASASGSSDAFVARLSAGGSLGWARRLGGSGNWDVGEGIALGPGASVYTIGNFTGSADFNPSSASFIVTAAAGQLDGYLSKLVNR